MRPLPGGAGPGGFCKPPTSPTEAQSQPGSPRARETTGRAPGSSSAQKKCPGLSGHGHSPPAGAPATLRTPSPGEQAQPHLLQCLPQFFTAVLYPLDHAAFCLNQAAVTPAAAVPHLSSSACRTPSPILKFARGTKRQGQLPSSGQRSQHSALRSLPLLFGAPGLTRASFSPVTQRGFSFTPNASLFPQRKTVKVALGGALTFETEKSQRDYAVLPILLSRISFTVLLGAAEREVYEFITTCMSGRHWNSNYFNSN